MKTLIALGGSIEALPILRRTKELGHRLIVVDGNPNAPGKAMADCFLHGSCYHAPTRTLMGFLKKECGPINGVLCAAIDAPQIAARYSELLGLPGLSEEQAALGADKFKQFQRLGLYNVPTPISYECVPHMGMPANKSWVVKPFDSRGARGVMRVKSSAFRGWSEIQSEYEYARAQSPTGRVMVEEWLNGPQLSTESIVQDGKVLFTAVGLRNYARLDEFAPYCIEDGFDSPHTPLAEPCELDALIENSCRALDWYQSGGGVVKGDLVIHDGKLHVIELAPRLSGGLFCAAHELAYGVDFIGAAINAALGYTLEMPRPYPRQFVSQRYIFPQPSDIGKRIVAQEERDYGAVFAHYSKPICHVIAPVTSHPDRLGQALCVGATPQEARERAERAVLEMYDGMVIE